MEPSPEEKGIKKEKKKKDREKKWLSVDGGTGFLGEVGADVFVHYSNAASGDMKVRFDEVRFDVSSPRQSKKASKLDRRRAAARRKQGKY